MYISDKNVSRVTQDRVCFPNFQTPPELTLPNKEEIGLEERYIFLPPMAQFLDTKDGYLL